MKLGAPKPLLEIDDLVVRFDTDDGIVRAVNGVSFRIHPRDVLAIVGESGSGKTVTAMSMLKLLPFPPAVIERGRVLWKGEDLLHVEAERLREVRGGEIGVIFQDPLTALNPVLTIGRQITETVRAHLGMTGSEARRHAIEMLRLVGIPQPERRVDMHPHEFSGGMRQRAMIAMAISCRPQLLIADEPTTALDVTVQAQVLELLVGITTEINSAILLITHDLGVVAGLANRVLVMYAGREIESGTVDDVFYRSSHPYTLGLLESLPRLDRRGRLHPIGGQPPSMLRLPTGCPFHPRCRFARLEEPCATDRPDYTVITPGHRAACHFAGEVLAVGASERGRS
jgi:oligopeptide/dipeptide ABC transporter ATP-binding protein